MKSHDAQRRTVDLLRSVGIAAAEERARAFPHELSGGLRQRAMIAMAIACNPRLLLADEPSTALDVTVQDQILTLLLQIQRESGMSMVLVSHPGSSASSSTLRVGLQSELDPLDPDTYYLLEGEDVIGSTYEGLLCYAPNATSTLEPLLATSWRMSSDGLTYTFTLRKVTGGLTTKPNGIESLCLSAQDDEATSGGRMWQECELIAEPSASWCRSDASWRASVALARRGE